MGQSGLVHRGNTGSQRENTDTDRRFMRYLQPAVLLLAAGAFALSVQAQVPAVAISGLPAEPLIGEQFCVAVDFTNTAAATGYGPYLAGILDKGISRLSVDFVDITPQVEPIGTFDSSGLLTDPISGIPLTGNTGGSATIVRYPVGSVDLSGAPLVMEVCGVVEEGTPVGVPLSIEIVPGLEFGNTPTGDNGPITGTSFSSTVTPRLARVSKFNSAPEGERPPGPSHVFSYSWVVDVSAGVTVDDVLLRDALPPEIQWTGGAISVAAPLGNNCAVTTLPSAPVTPSGEVVVECSSVTGTSSEADLTVKVPVYIVDILNEGIPDQQAISNTVDLQYQYQGTGYSHSSSSDVLAVHAAVQKNVTGTPLPGEVLTYAVDFQLTDYPDDPNLPAGGATDFIFSDILPDGMSFDGTLDLVVNGNPVGISETATLNSPGPGETIVVWDVGAALGSVLPTGSSGTLRYRARILQTYADGSTPVQAADNLVNNIELEYGLTDGGAGVGRSTAPIEIRPNTPDKLIQDPNPLPPAVSPGDVITFRLSMAIPSGSTSNVRFVDHLPKPVFDVASFDTVLDWTVLPPFAGLTPTVTRDIARNSVSFDFGDINTSSATTLAVDIRIAITGSPFHDGLFLTNLFSSSYENATGKVVEGLQAAALTVGAPDLKITKGVSSVGNPRGSISPAAPSDPTQALVEGDATGVDAFDAIQYTITVENIGSQSAYNVTVREDVPAGLSCSPLASGDVVNGNGIPLGFTGDLFGSSGMVLSDPLQGNDDNPPGGGAPFAADTALLTVNCVLGSSVTPAETITNKASVSWVSTPGGSEVFPVREDTASVTIAVPVITKAVVGAQPGYNGNPRRVHVGEVVTYQLDITVPEGTSPAVRLEDILNVGLAHVDVVSITATPGLSSSVGAFDPDVIGNAGFLPTGGGLTAPDRKLVFGPGNSQSGFGDVTNANTNNNVADVISVVYRTRVLNWSTVTNGHRLRNQARWYWQPNGPLRRQHVQVRSRPVTVIEPKLRLTKAFLPATGDSLTPPRVVMSLGHAGGSTADAFDLHFSDSLPDDMGIVGGAGGVTLSNCPAATLVDVTRVQFSDVLTIEWDQFDTSVRQCTVSFQSEFIRPVAAGLSMRNCASLDWQSLAVLDQPLVNPPNNVIAAERTGNNNDVGGAANTYVREACDTFKVYDVSIDKTVTATSQAHTDNVPGTPPGAESLAIGELVTFELLVTVPETPVTELEVTDALPKTAMVLELLSARTTFVGGDLSPSDPAPSPLISDTSSDGFNDTVVLDYGSVGHILDGITNDADRIRIEVVARVVDVSANASNDLDHNTGIVRFLPNLSASDDFVIELVEPVLGLEKTGDKSRVEAGDEVLYQLTVRHRDSSRADARDLELFDTLPPELALVPGSAVVGSVCTVPPTVGPSQSIDTVTASWADFPLGAICEIEFRATVNVSAITGQQIVNDSNIFWTSLDTQGDPHDRSYRFDDQWTVTVSEPGISKELTSTSIPDTSDQDGALTIGESVTFTLQASFPDGTSPAVRVEDLLPAQGVALRFVSTRIVAIGGDLTLSNSPAVGDAAVACVPARDNCLQWVLGDVVNLPDNRPNPDLEDAIVFEVEAIVLDDPLNSGAPGVDKNLLNTALLVDANTRRVATAQFNLVEPELEITKLTENGGFEQTVGAGDVHRFTLVVAHSTISTATAHTIQILDQLAPEMEWVDNSSVQGTCPGLQLNRAPLPGSSGPVEFSFDKLPLDNKRCEISFAVRMSTTLPVPGTYENTVVMSWESAPGLPQSRNYTDRGLARLVAYIDALVIKEVTATSVPDTGAAVADPKRPDVTIGELVEYVIVAKFTEGVTQNVVLRDTFQSNGAGEFELVGGGVDRVGRNVSASNPGLPVVSGNVITIDYGSVTNVADGVQDVDDTIVYRLELRVKDVAGNVVGGVLQNQSELQYNGATGTPQFLVDEALVDVVEPVLAMTKRFTGLQVDVATIELEIVNTGSSTAFDLVVTDEFDEAIWVPGSLSSVVLPAGYELVETSSGGVTTVTLRVANPAVPPVPTEILKPGETLTAVFSMRLQNNGQPGPTVIPNTAVLVATSLPGPDPNERVYTVDATDTLRLPAIALTKTWAGPNNPARPGDSLTYTLTLANTGDAPATGISITDTPDTIGAFQVGSVVAPGGLVVFGNNPGDNSINVSFATLAGGSSATVNYNVIVPRPYADGFTLPEELVNQAGAASLELSPVVSNDPNTPAVDDPTVVPIVADPVLRVSKDDQVAMADPGDTLIYVIQYSNSGDQDATGVVLTETVPNNSTFSAVDSSPGWACQGGGGPGDTCTLNIGSMAGLSSSQALFAVVIDATVPAGVIRIDNEVTVEDDGHEFDPGAPVVPSTDRATESTPLIAIPELEVFKDDGGIAVVPSQTYAYQIYYRNVGNQESTGIVLTETVPDHTSFDSGTSLPPNWACASGGQAGDVCTLNVADLPAGFGNIVNFGLRVAYPAPPGADLIFNTVLLEDDGQNSLGVPLRDQNGDTTPLVAVPDLTLTKQSSAGTVEVNDVVTYTLDYANAGDQDATGVVVEEVVPEGSVFSAPDSLPTLWSCADGAVAGTPCEYSVGPLAAGSSGQVRFAVIATEIPADQKLVNVAIVRDDGNNGQDPTPGNNIAKVSNGFPIPTIPALNAAWLLLLALSLVGVAGNSLRRRVH